MGQDIISFFNQRKDFFKQKEQSEQKLSNRFSNIRLFVFLAFFAGWIYCFAEKEFPLFFLSLFVFALVYIPLLIKHRKVKEKALDFKLLALVNQQEVSRVKGELSELDSGSKYYELAHPYSKDLDVFGQASLFQLINRCSTESGKKLLASWLSEPKSKPEIEKTQTLVQELTPEAEFRQKIQVEGEKYEVNLDQQESLLSWLSSAPYLQKQKYLPALVYTLNFITLAVIIAVLLAINWKWLLVPVAINVLLLNLNRKYTSDALEQTEKSAVMLKSFAGQVQMLEQAGYKSQKFSEIQAMLQRKGHNASYLIKKLATRFGMLEYGRNPYFYIIANFTFLWDLHWTISIDKWRTTVKDEPKNWFNALNQFEAIASFAGLARANPEWVYPEISDKDFVFEGQKIAHPLIFSDERISNDFSMAGKGVTWIITGSNMSGKSTFLRTLGLNAVLALAGAPVCAQSLTISPLRVFTSMRTEDNLQESTSSFYAELKRLKQLLEYLGSGLPVFYLLDEILKGTNSDDRHTGGMALVRQLQDKNASGIIATHDLELGKLEEESPETIHNYSFSSEVVKGELYFDYKLKEGICRSFNATELMKKIGINFS